ncbi:MAG: N-acetyltransferase [Candidatus Paceibacterota bacterium]
MKEEIMLQVLIDAAAKNEIILIEGGYCLWHLRKNGQLTISEILSIKKGAGNKMLSILKKKKAFKIVAKCPVHYDSNEWYKRRGFKLVKVEKTRSTNKDINVWELQLDNIKTFNLKK